MQWEELAKKNTQEKGYIDPLLSYQRSTIKIFEAWFENQKNKYSKIESNYKEIAWNMYYERR